MSETKDTRRTRRRASRTAGPPVESATEQPTVAAETPASAHEAATPAAAASTGKAVSNVAGGTDTGAARGSDSADAGESTGTAAIPTSRKATTEEDDTTGSAAAATEKFDEATRRTGTVESGAAETTVRMDKSAAVAAGTDTGKAESTGTVVSMEKTDTEAATGSADGGGGRSWKRIVALAAAAVLVLGLVGAAVVSTVAVQSTEQRDERRAEYVATARQTILNLTTIRADTAKEDIDRILTMASGEFKTEFDGRIDPFTEIVKQAKVQSTGEVVEAAVERDDEKSAVILVAAKQTLTNAGAEGEQQRFYRFRVTVQRGDDGSLTASDVEFVA